MRSRKIAAFAASATLATLVCVLSSGCQSSSNAAGYGTGSGRADNAIPSSKHEGEFAAHGGALNAIVTCENGHAEIKKDGKLLSLWFVDGGTSSDKAVRVAALAVPLDIRFGAGKASHRLVLQPRPIALAGETAGDCSHFEASAPWLADAKSFTATGEVTFKGNKCPLRIEYPKGYDPD